MEKRVRSSTWLWLPPLIGTVIYPVLILLFSVAIGNYHKSGDPTLAVYATLLMLLAGSIPLIAGREPLALP